jgi:Zn-finger nucleic acid-binding protein
MPNRDAFPTCPDCAVALQTYGTRLGCDTCGGTLVTVAELLELLNSFDSKHPRSLDWPEIERPSRRRCPCCEAIMIGVRMESVPVERCAAHGIWFDRGELAKVLAPDADADEFARENQLRQDRADQMEYGSLGLLLREIYRAVRARMQRRRDVTDRDRE